MAKSCTYPNVLGLLSLTVCVILATSAPARPVREATDGSGCDQLQGRDMFNSVTDLVSSNILCHW